MKTGIELIADERERQITAEGWTPEHDDTHTEGELADAAAAYAVCDRTANRDVGIGVKMVQSLWPWDAAWFKRRRGVEQMGAERLHELAKAGALIAAEIDRLQRADARCRAALTPSEASEPSSA